MSLNDMQREYLPRVMEIEATLANLRLRATTNEEEAEITRMEVLLASIRRQLNAARSPVHHEISLLRHARYVLRHRQGDFHQRGWEARGSPRLENGQRNLRDLDQRSWQYTSSSRFEDIQGNWRESTRDVG